MKSLTNNSIELELMAGMQKQLVSQARDDLSSAADYLNSAAEIFEDLNMHAKADKVLNILLKIATQGIKDSHVDGLTSEKMVNNLKNHGTVFNMADDGNDADGILDLDINNLEVSENSVEEGDFEDEK